MDVVGVVLALVLEAADPLRRTSSLFNKALSVLQGKVSFLRNLPGKSLVDYFDNVHSQSFWHFALLSVFLVTNKRRLIKRHRACTSGGGVPSAFLVYISSNLVLSHLILLEITENLFL